MKRSIIIFMSLVLVFSFAIVSSSAEKATTTKKRKQITGIVTAINTENNTITVKKKDKEIVLYLFEKTNIRQCTKKQQFPT